MYQGLRWEDLADLAWVRPQPGCTLYGVVAPSTSYGHMQGVGWGCGTPRADLRRMQQYGCVGQGTHGAYREEAQPERRVRGRVRRAHQRPRLPVHVAPVVPGREPTMRRRTLADELRGDVARSFGGESRRAHYRRRTAGPSETTSAGASDVYLTTSDLRRSVPLTSISPRLICAGRCL